MGGALRITFAKSMRASTDLSFFRGFSLSLFLDAPAAAGACAGEADEMAVGLGSDEAAIGSCCVG